MERGGGQERERRERGQEEDLTQDASPLTLQEWQSPDGAVQGAGAGGVGVGWALPTWI